MYNHQVSHVTITSSLDIVEMRQVVQHQLMTGIFLFEKIVLFLCHERNPSPLLVIVLLNGIHNSCTPLLVGTWGLTNIRSVHFPCTDQKRGTIITCREHVEEKLIKF